MKITNPAASLAFAVCLLFAYTAGADGIYVELAPGVSIFADSDISVFGLSGDVEFDTGFVIGGAVGYRFLDQPEGLVDQIRGELNLSYREADIEKLTSGGLELPGAGDVSAIALMANVYYDFDIGFPVTPYLGAGIGFAHIEIDSQRNAILVVNDDSTEFAWNVMLGASYAASEAIDLSLGYRYLVTTDPEFDASITGVGSQKLDAEISLHEILFGLRYNF